MKKSLLILTTLLIAWNASAQWNIKGFSVKKHDKLKTFCIETDSLKLKSLYTMCLKPERRITFLVIIENLLYQIFSEDEIKQIKKEKNTSEAWCLMFLKYDGTIEGLSFSIPYAEKDIYTQEKVEKWLRFWEGKNLKKFIEPGIGLTQPLEESTGVLQVYIAYDLVHEVKTMKAKGEL